MAKVIGYILSILGLIAVALSNKIAALSFLSGFGSKALIYVVLAAVILIILGIVFIMSDNGFSKTSKVKHASEEVPIFEGEGKKKKIVGYKRA